MIHLELTPADGSALIGLIAAPFWHDFNVSFVPGGKSVRFILCDEVNMPRGRKGHTFVVDAVVGEFANGADNIDRHLKVLADLGEVTLKAVNMVKDFSTVVKKVLPKKMVSLEIDIGDKKIAFKSGLESLSADLKKIEDSTPMTFTRTIIDRKMFRMSSTIGLARLVPIVMTANTISKMMTVKVLNDVNEFSAKSGDVEGTFQISKEDVLEYMNLKDGSVLIDSTRLRHVIENLPGDRAEFRYASDFPLCIAGNGEDMHVIALLAPYIEEEESQNDENREDTR